MESKSKSKSLCQTNTQTTRNHKPACCQHLPGDCNSAVGWTQSPAFASITSRGWPVHEANILIDPLSTSCINRATRICKDMPFMYVKLPRRSPRHCQISVSARIWLTHDYGYPPRIYSSYNMVFKWLLKMILWDRLASRRVGPKMIPRTITRQYNHNWSNPLYAWHKPLAVLENVVPKPLINGQAWIWSKKTPENGINSASTTHLVANCSGTRAQPTIYIHVVMPIMVPIVSYRNCGKNSSECQGVVRLLLQNVWWWKQCGKNMEKTDCCHCCSDSLEPA